MIRSIALIKFTEKGLSHIAQSPDRAAQFRAAVNKAGGAVELQLWTVGPYDGVVVFTAPDEETAAALTLRLGRGGDVSTCTLRAFDAEQFKSLLGKLGS